MLRTLALLLVALFAAPISAAIGTDIEVKVVDEAGRPVAGVKVVLESTPFSNRLQIAPALSDAHGIARIDVALDLIRNDAAQRYSVRLLLPLAREVRADLDRAHLGDGHATLVVPPLGSVVFRTPAEVQQSCSVQLYALGTSRAGEMHEPLPFTRQDLEVRAGLARCDLVGLGQGFQYRFSGVRGSGAAVGRLVGPTRAGQVVTIDLPAPPPEPRVLARLVDADGNPLAHASIEWRFGGTAEFPYHGGCEFSRGLLAADEQGRIALPIQGGRLDAAPPGVRARGRTLVLALRLPSQHGKWFPIDGPSVQLRIPPFQSGQDLDLGEQSLLRFGSSRRYRELDDQTLEHNFLHFADVPFLAVGGDVHTELLSEMVRRGGPEFERFVSEVLQGLAEHPRDLCAVDRLLLLTALYRLQGRSDPLTIRRDGPEELELGLPGSIEFAFEIENNASENGPLELPLSGNWPRPAIEIHDAHGERIPQPLGKRRSEQQRWTPLAPGESRILQVQGEMLFLPGPGDYRVRVHCSPSEDLDQLSSLDGRIYFSSPEFTLHVRERPAR